MSVHGGGGGAGHNACDSGGDLSCNGNSPAPQFGDSGGSPSTVGGHVRGQCKKLVGP